MILSAAGADMLERMLRTSGRRIDMSQPVVDVMMAEPSRLQVVIPDMARNALLACANLPRRAADLHEQ